MISFVRGRVTTARPGEVVVDVGGIGLALQCTPSTAAALRIGDEVQLPAMLIVREESLTLFDSPTRTSARSSNCCRRPRPAARAGHARRPFTRRPAPGGGHRGSGRADPRARYRQEGGPAHRRGARRQARPAGRSYRHDNRDRENDATERLAGSGPCRAAGLGWSGREADAAVDEVAPLIGDGVDAADVSTLLKALRTLARP